MYLKNPKTNKKIFLDNRYSKYEDRLREVEKWFFGNEDLIAYCMSNAMIKNNKQMTSYYNAEQILENVGTYLLLGQYEKNDILTIYKIRRGDLYEVPVSCSYTVAEDVMYSHSSQIDVSAKVEIYSDFSKEKFDGFEKFYFEMSLREINKSEHKDKNRRKTYRKSRSFRLNSLYSTKEFKTYKVRQQFYKDESGKKKPMKNVIGQPIFDAEYVTIGGNKGIIDDNNRYGSQWCIVNTDNVFTYKNEKYKISSKCKQYRVRDDNQCDMEKILVVPVDGKLNFFDENIKKVLDLFVDKVV